MVTRAASPGGRGAREMSPILMNKTPQEKLLEQLAMLSEYADTFPPADGAYGQEDDFGLAVSQTLTRVFVDGCKLKLGEPQCISYLKACAKTSKAQGNPLKTMLGQLVTLRSDPIEVVHQVVRNYMRNMMVQNLLAHASLGVQETQEYFDTAAFLMDGKRREFLRGFLRRMQECTFNIEVLPPDREVSLKDLREELHNYKKKQSAGDVGDVAAGLNQAQQQSEAEQNQQTSAEDKFAIEVEKEQNFAAIEPHALGDIISSFTSFQSAQETPPVPKVEAPKVTEEPEQPKPCEDQQEDHPSHGEAEEHDVTVQHDAEAAEPSQQRQEAKEEQPNAPVVEEPNLQEFELQMPAGVQEAAMQSYSPSTSTSQIKTGESGVGVGQRASQSCSLPKFEEMKVERLVAQPQETYYDPEAPKRVELEDSDSDQGMLVIAPQIVQSKDVAKPLVVQEADQKQNTDKSTQDAVQEAPSTDARRNVFLENLVLLGIASGDAAHQDDFKPHHWITDARHYGALEETFKFVSPGVDAQIFVSGIIAIGAEYCSINQRDARKIGQLESRWNPRQIVGAQPVSEESISIKGVIHALRNASQQSEENAMRLFRHGEDVFIVPLHVAKISYAFSFPEIDINRQLSLQNNQCAGCRRKIGEDDEFWFCSYSGAYFCALCRAQPVKLCGAIRQLEFSDILVAQSLAAKLAAEYVVPSVLSDSLPQCIRGKQMFKQVENARRVLLLCQAHVNSCQRRSTLSAAMLAQFRPRIEIGLKQFSVNPEEIKTQEHMDALAPKGIFGIREHLGIPEQAVMMRLGDRLVCKSVGYWSYRDIIDMFDGPLLQILQRGVSSLREHAQQCDLCSKAQEELCSCGKRVNLFDEGVYACPECGTLQHLKCVRRGSCRGCSYQ